MEQAILKAGIIPFFKNAIPGYSIQELTRQGFWFDDEEGQLGPWDWKVDCLLNGGIAYGKFLGKGKASFATVPMYRELMNVRRATTSPDENGQKVMALLNKQDSVTIREIRSLLGVKKSAADSIISKLQYQCRIVTGALERVYNGPCQTYKGWQVSYFCTPESLFGDVFSLKTEHSPEKSLEILIEHISGLLDKSVSKDLITKMLVSTSEYKILNKL